MNKSAGPDLPPYAVSQRIAAKAQRARIMGSAALDICHVACGKADGYFEAGIYLWDIAAGDLIVRQAGGKTEPLIKPNKNHRLQFLATNGHIHAELKKLVQERS